ncbi:tyrosine-type recombinase/integrase [Methanosarcina sp.]|uniref:tyrosine-type recombinase/integrase n=1 Tax=Methanosarcina sp. TaxID=2213 RepID=UPI003BB60205
MGIYEYNVKILLPKLQERIRTAEYSEVNRSLLLEFANCLFAEGIRPLRVLKYLSILNNIAEGVEKDFPDMKESDVISLVAKIEMSDLADSTKMGKKIVLRRFIKWLLGEEVASKIKITKKMNSHKLPDSLITETEIKNMIETADHPRDKALIAVLYDSGCRIGEIGGLQVKHVSFDQYGAVLAVHGKTGSRRVRIMFSASYISAWLDIHPQKNKQDAFVFVKINGEDRDKQMQYHAIRRIVEKTAEKAGIEKRIHPHLFRHSRSTELAQYLTEAQMEEHLGWVQGSNMPRTYIHLSGKQIDDAILGMYGKKKKEEMLPELTSRTCPRCEKDNGPTSKFCARCGLPLDIQTMQEIQSYDEDFRKVYELFRKMKEGGT